RITDFGLVRPLEELARPDDLTRPELVLTEAGEPLLEKLTRIGALIGTPRFMPPEQLAGKDVDARADQYSFCVALYEALYGAFPFQLTAGDQLARAIQQGQFLRPAAGRWVPGWLRKVLVRGLSAAPEARFPGMDALLDALEAGRDRARRPRAAAVIGWVALGVAIGAAGVLLARGP
ncbi:MAG TPA: protein kinase, partial [Myxococcaceae bacterium]|nr:protein kinase [Myxococcaceae bacterium]